MRIFFSINCGVVLSVVHIQKYILVYCDLITRKLDRRAVQRVGRNGALIRTDKGQIIVQTSEPFHSIDFVSMDIDEMDGNLANISAFFRAFVMSNFSQCIRYSLALL